MATGDDGIIPGMTIAGRYRLLAPHGRRPLLRFWHALDVGTGRDVGLSLVDTAGELPVEFVHEILARTIRLRGLGKSGVAKVLDVLHTGAFGVVVSEWVCGGSLRQIADTRPAPATVATMMRSLAAAAEAAHRAGLVLSIDDPARLRVSDDGHVALAFPATLPESTSRSDLRGIGCALYAAMLREWPGPAAQPPEPAVVDPGIPFLISTTTAALLRDDGGIASAATLLTLLDQAGVESEAEESSCRIMAPLPPPLPGAYAGFRNFGPEEEREAARRIVIRGGLGAAAAIVLVAILALGSSLNGFLEANDDTVAMDADQLGLQPTQPAPEPPEPTKAVRGVGPGERVALTGAGVFSPDGSPDSPNDAGLAIDGKPDTAWATDRYYDADPFPKFKPGVGLVVSLREATSVNAVTVEQNSTGSMVQVRGSEGPDPKTLADTVELTPPIPVEPGTTRIPVSDARPMSRVVVWITKLGSSDGQNRAAIAEIGVHAASAPA
ncbi:protein kinase family protein [Mycobacterium sp. IDR2000157661]|uniref:protein kinase family protein n=1 Tax=Mycobacterium sp. IDR2000157661 TaxID=2867005 RepID=UPI001EE9C82C|nr:protein kinase family protein [Mycobacterium sp. IDR2000157661]ULE34563.1 protein kinase family protein [Mycobacterium sp. IDR2000157661]